MIDEQELLRTLGQHIRAVRKARGLTQEQLAELCEFDPTYVSLLERGQRNPPYLTLCLLADKLNSTVDALIGGSSRAA